MWAAAIRPGLGLRQRERGKQRVLHQFASLCQRVVDALTQVDSRDQTSIGWPVKLSEGQQ
jgi:hypothetical protein